MSRTLSLAMPKKRQYGGMIGSTPQTSTPIPNVGGITWMGGSPPQLSPQYQQMVNKYGSVEKAKIGIDEERAKQGLPSLYNPPPSPEEMAMMMKKKKPDYSSYAHAEKGANAKGSDFPVQNIGEGKGLGVIGGGMQGPLREVVTGGYGAAPAKAGRIGYRGTLKERPGSGSRQSGLAGFYAMQNKLGQMKAGQNAIDPVTGMSYQPTQMQQMEQMEIVGKKYGPYERGLLSDYYEAGRTGSIADQQRAAAAINERKQWLNTQRQAAAPKIPDALKRREPTVPNYFGNAMNDAQSMTSSPMKFEHGGQNKSSPIPIAPTNTGGRNPDGIPVKDAMDKLRGMTKAMGGNNEPVKPYIVNEKGEEAWQPDGENPQLMPGKEKMVLFPKDGKVIPHGRTMEMAKKGKVEMPEHAATGKDISTRKFSNEEAQALNDAIARAKFWNPKVSSLNPAEWMGGSRSSLPPELSAASGAPEKYDVGSIAERIAADNQTILNLLKSGRLKNLSHYDPNNPNKFIPEFELMNQEEGAEQIGPPETAIPVGPPETAMPVGPPETAMFVGPPESSLIAGPPESAIPVGPPESAKPKAPPTPEQIRTSQGYTPEEQALLAQGQEMTSRGITQMGPTGDVKFASGGGIEGGKAYGPNVVEQQAPVTIRPGVIKDELGDVGTRLAKQKEDKEFMKRWESDLKSGKAPTTEKAFKTFEKRQYGGRTKSFAK